MGETCDLGRQYVLVLRLIEVLPPYHFDLKGGIIQPLGAETAVTDGTQVSARGYCCTRHRFSS